MNEGRERAVARIHAREMDPARFGDAVVDDVFGSEEESPFAHVLDENGRVICTTPGRGTPEGFNEEGSDFDPYFYNGHLASGIPCVTACETERGPSMGTLDGALRFGRSPFETDAIEAIYEE